MGVKVNKVKDKRTLEEVTVEDCMGGYDGEYVCHVNGCDAEMSFVHSYEQRRLDKVITVPSFFKLKQNQKHSYEFCPYNTEGAVKVIARDSDPNVLRSLDNNKYEFSLQILHKPEFSETETGPINDSIESLNKKSPKGKVYTRKGTASSYLKVLNQVLALRAKLEEDSELASLIVLNYRGKKVKWSDFYFEEEQYISAYKLVEDKKEQYPMCFQGVISKLIRPTEKFKYWKIKLHSPFYELIDKVTPIPSIELIIADKGLDLSEYSEGQRLLAYGVIKTSVGEWVPPKERDEKEPKKIKFLNMSLWINHHEQIADLKP
ncbi:hypothetical protein [uncultured Idiomarina sp.]|uniref:hypothetical protein n=1 Tax=uncultured Idiomarina sp. TaxID=352961 RepID=UPI002594352E|nr:hypothetical protein [uncultured Idiomarina sp.]